MATSEEIDQIRYGLKDVLREEDYDQIEDYLDNAYKMGEGATSKIYTDINYEDKPALILNGLTYTYEDLASEEDMEVAKREGIKL